MSDMINSPDHYTQGDIECIDAMAAQSTEEEFQGFLRLSVVKYLWRFRTKGKAAEDLKKARWFLGRLLDTVPNTAVAESYDELKHQVTSVRAKQAALEEQNAELIRRTGNGG